MAMAPHLLNGIVYCLGNGVFFARQEDIDKPRVFWYSIKRPLGPCWCGAMAAQLICNQWVAGSTPVTSSKKKSCDIPLKQRRVSWDFCFSMRCKSIRMCLVCALLLKKCLVGVPYRVPCAGCPAGRFCTCLPPV